MSRCPWCGDDPLYVRYHDEEWGVPVHDDLQHFEFLVLEAAQAGLSWRTVLGKRERYRQVFHRFDPVRVAAMTGDDVERLMLDAGIIRNRLKITAAIHNAPLFLDIQAREGSFDRYLWAFVDGQPVVGSHASMADVPATTELSDRVSKDLKARGFKFVGSTVIYAHLQAVGVVNDHLRSCFRWEPLSGAVSASSASPRPSRRRPRARRPPRR